MDIYTENILDHYKNPRNFGHLKNPTHSNEEDNPLCGDKLNFELKINRNDRVIEIAFSGEGCAISMASASMLSEELNGKSINEIEKIDDENVLKLLGIPVSQARMNCALMALMAVRKAIDSK